MIDNISKDKGDSTIITDDSDYGNPTTQIAQTMSSSADADDAPTSPISPSSTIAPDPPQWRFVRKAKKTEGYSSDYAGLYVRGKLLYMHFIIWCTYFLQFIIHDIMHYFMSLPIPQHP